MLSSEIPHVMHDGKNVDMVLTEFGIRFHCVIYDHLLQFQFNSFGLLSRNIIAILLLNTSFLYSTCQFAESVKLYILMVQMEMQFTLNNASDYYQTNELYRTPNPSPFVH